MEKPGSSAYDLTRVEEIARRSSNLAGALIPVLHEVQKALGFVPSDAAPVIARILNLSRAEVHGVLTFYRDFRTVPRARHAIRICKAESCQAMGGGRLAAHIERRLGVISRSDANGSVTSRSSDARISVEPVYCLGNCALSPAIMIDGRVLGRVTPESFDELLGKLEVG